LKTVIDLMHSAAAGPAEPSPRAKLAAVLEVAPGPLAGAVAAALLAEPSGGPIEAGFITFVTLLIAAGVADRRVRWAPLLPLMGAVARVTGPVLGIALLALLELLTGLPGIGGAGIVAVGVVAGVALLAGEFAVRRIPDQRRAQRIAVVGPDHATASLERELAGAANADYLVVGRIAIDSELGGLDDETLLLGTLDDLGGLVSRHDVDLLLMTADVPRLAVFDEISRSCLHLPVRLQELAAFYEDTFGHVPVAEINAAWFQYIMHPRYRHSSPLAQRVLDVVISAILIVALAPVLALICLAIRRDGGPALFKQRRIGDGGREFTIWKLRTMTVGASSAWAGADDARVTRLGSILRRTHVDELPQLFNILAGDMSLVGPRPEQPDFVERLEQSIPFYSRRHLVKPGLTGWAQVRCGYAGSEIGSAWKVSHDLFYLKHRSMGLNLMILGETLRTLVADRQYSAQPATVAFILRPESGPGTVAVLPDAEEWAAASGLPATSSA
jgi:exopolysaccharide biosynthesis polyprenyl glycosylphosphotransferase